MMIVVGIMSIIILKLPKIPELNIYALQVDFYSVLIKLLISNSIQVSINILMSIYDVNSHILNITNT